MNKKKYIHFIGIGGYGMSGIASIMLKLHYKVSGSDIRDTAITKKLKDLGALIHVGHKESNIEYTQAVVISSAISGTNPEVIRANELGIPIYNRAEMLQFIMDGYEGIAVAGTHGKTTTTSLLSYILEKSGTDPTVVIGGEVNEFGGNSKLGYGTHAVVEADESDGSFLYLSPKYSLVTNIDEDHMDYYQDKYHIMNTFKEFISRTDKTGKVLLCSDCENIQSILPDIEEENIITYGTDVKYATMIAKDVKFEQFRSTYKLYRRNRFIGNVEITLPGEHNILNSIGAITLAMEIGIPFEKIAEAVKYFHGADRRFQMIGEYNSIKIIDDYAHHPVEVKATLSSALQVSPGRTVTIFQPHRYSRTQQFYREFAAALNPADLIIIDTIFAASENPINGIDSDLIVKEIKKLGHKNVQHVSGKDNILEHIIPRLKKNDLIITIGAGDITYLGPTLLAKLKSGKKTKKNTFAA